MQPGDCVTVKTCPAIVAVPVRAGPFVAATATVTLPIPDPVVVPIEIQSALLAAVHGQPADDVIMTVCVPPDAPTA